MSAPQAVGMRVAALRDFLVLLATAPHPDSVARALAVAGLLPLRATSTAVWAVADRQLTRIGTYRGPDASELRPLLESVPLTSSDPTARSALSSSIVRSHSPNPASPAQLRVPVVSAGIVIGVYAADGLDDGPLTADDILLLETVADATSLWLDHRSASPPPGASTSALTRRQQQILMLVLAGSTNASIAATLGCSVATVKVELRAVNRLLGTHDRRGAAANAHDLRLIVPDGAG
jgi:DNA-binding CsgD family transcriptional regulator